MDREAYLEPSQTFMTEHFYEKVNYSQKNSIIDALLGSKYASGIFTFLA